MTAVLRDLHTRYHPNPKRITRPVHPPPHTLPSDPMAGSYPGRAALILDKLTVTLPSNEAFAEARRRLGLCWHPLFHRSDALRPTGKVVMETTIGGYTVRIGAHTWHDSHGLWQNRAYITDGTFIDTGDFAGVWHWWHRESPILRTATWTFAALPILDAACWEAVLRRWHTAQAKGGAR
jgi:hypothetical protein